jgi:hypothetical protein
MTAQPSPLAPASGGRLCDGSYVRFPTQELNCTSEDCTIARLLLLICRRGAAGAMAETDTVRAPSIMHAPISKRLKHHGNLPLQVLCPITKNPILTRIGTDVRSLSKTWHSNIQVSCPHCNMTHKYRVSDAFTETAISDELMRGSAMFKWA